MRSAGLKSKIPWEKMFSSIIYGSKKYWRVIHSPVNFLRIFPWCCCGWSWRSIPKPHGQRANLVKICENLWFQWFQSCDSHFLHPVPPQAAVFHEPAWFLMRPGLKNRAIAPGKNRSWRCGFPKNQCAKPNSNHPEKRFTLGLPGPHQQPWIYTGLLLGNAMRHANPRYKTQAFRRMCNFLHVYACVYDIVYMYVYIYKYCVHLCIIDKEIYYKVHIYILYTPGFFPSIIPKNHQFIKKREPVINAFQFVQPLIICLLQFQLLNLAARQRW